MTELKGDAPHRVFRDRHEAGRVLAELLEHYRGAPNLLILGLPRGGIPVAWEVAAALDAPMDALVVRKLGAPGNPEFAIGALSSGGRIVLNDDLVRALRLTAEQVRAVATAEAEELRRREGAYRAGRGPVEVAGRTVILVDDGSATGASMRAAVDAVRAGEPERIVVAVPAAPESTCRELGAAVDEVVCATVPSPFRAVGESFWDFAQVTDAAVRTLMTTTTTGIAVPPTDAAAIVRAAAIPAPAGVPADDVLSDIVGAADVVLIGESSHGTADFYAARAKITRFLIEQKGFTAVAAEADWPDAHRVNLYLHGQGRDATAEQALRGFERFPAWMWRNTEVRDFLTWLHEHNVRQHEHGSRRTGFYGLDLYSLHRSMAEVIGYLDTVDTVAAQRARIRYGCFDHTSGDDGQAYGFAAAFGAGRSCEAQAIRQLVELQRTTVDGTELDPAVDRHFDAVRNACSVRDAEAYYRTMFGDRVDSWNLRDRHMADTLDALREHLDAGRQRDGEQRARIVVWAHNSHVGDARATEMRAQGQLTLGQLVRERYGERCVSIGFSTCAGTVTAADEWGGPALRRSVREALPSSVEELLHDTGIGEFALRMDRPGDAVERLRHPRLQRAIGVIYRPGTERQSHYFHTRVAEQFDALIHIDRTTALEPLEPSGEWVAGTIPETYPSGL
ncbi:erythromycin esterase family protein [Nocardia bovistercoris]|uniref:Erythromycin esterase family protein n=1 Tax=Nocardia bovistercoris TaxID=2785916 RepID=A0A931II79_9NOCA|nr:erythromycin esterase family protein [Nocardia bovistercoris]MBH0781063.1 erythromycin esterase family protein [Nocardia bovistercoris]